MNTSVALTATQKKLINHFQSGFPLCSRPYLAVAETLGLSEEEVIDNIRTLLDERILARFGPLYQEEALGGGLSLVAMTVPLFDFDRVTDIVNRFPEVARNYHREHELNMWFVLATGSEQEISKTLEAIEQATGYLTFNMPAQQEFYCETTTPCPV